MTRIFLVRHGPTHAKGMVGWTDLEADLSDTASLQRLSAHLPQDALIVSSDLRRCVATADAIMAGRRRLAHVRDLREMHFGDWEMQRFDEIEDQVRYRAFWEQPGDVRPPNGESWNAVTDRVSRAIDRLLAAHDGKDLIIVAHFGVILTQVQRAMNISPYEAFGHRIDNLSMTEIQIREGAWDVVRLNQVL